MKRILLLIIVTVLLFFVYFASRQTVKQNPLQATALPLLQCPVSKEYCTKGKIITVKGQFVGIGYSVPVGAPIYAVFSGGLRPGWIASSNGRKPLIILENKEKQTEAVYQITGQDFTRYNAVKQGGKIGEAREGNIDQFGVNLIISIRRLDNKTNSIIPIKTSDFIPL
ncbi:hypothetical protein [Candidatus Amarolinea dominans]|uniref:hypothetical protein n=1 Tax=Candidatus Amarolinea dominans TaxID=3140696 RepID=UPI003135F7AC|nr:hypothetical protein [Anaerolineae bacterium]